jgi:hypothetical protein
VDVAATLKFASLNWSDELLKREAVAGNIYAQWALYFRAKLSDRREWLEDNLSMYCWTLQRLEPDL